MNNYQWLLQMDRAERKAWFDAEHVETKERAIDGDTEPQDGDSRDQIIADVRKYFASEVVMPGEEIDNPMCMIRLSDFISMLNRQVAIDNDICDECSHDYYELQDERDELQAQVHELQAALDLISISLALPMTSKPITPDMRKPEVLAKLIIETIKKLANEREHYRSKFSRALGYADDIHALMDEGMA